MLYNAQEEGQGLVEYALILVLIAVVVIAVLTLLGPIITDVFGGIGSALALNETQTEAIQEGVDEAFAEVDMEAEFGSP